MKYRIAKVIKESGLSRTKFAGRIKITPAFLSQICAGARNPSDRTIDDICREFSVNPDWLRRGEGDPYMELSREDKIMQMAGRVTTGSDVFKKNVLYLLSQLDEQDWKNLIDIFDKCKDILQK